MKKILGLDLGITSIGWAVVGELEATKTILGMGSRIIPLSSDDKDEFTSGNAISKNQKRTLKRTQRRGYDRYQIRRWALVSELKRNNIPFDESLFNLTSYELYGLRDRAIKEKISLQEFARVLYHLNQRRGYKSSRGDSNLTKKDTEYVAEVKNRYQKIIEDNLTVGQLFFQGLTLDKKDEEWRFFCKRYGLNPNLPFRIKQQVFPREAYIEEYDRICKKQQEFYPNILSDSFIDKIKDNVIYYQRSLKSQKGLVSVCEFEGFFTKNKEGREIFVGPKVAPRSSPLFQIEKIWETINDISLRNKRGEHLIPTLEDKRKIFEHLDNHEKLSLNDLFNILGLKKEDGWYGNKQISKGIQGNTTKFMIKKCFNNTDEFEHLFRFNIDFEENRIQYNTVDTKTGEVIRSRIINSGFEKEPLYQLWHLIYSIAEKDDLIKTLGKRFYIPLEVSEKLVSLDFKKQAFGSKSCKAIRKILPYLMDGYVYSDACYLAGYNHSESLTSEENLSRQLVDKIPNLLKNSLRQPIVEKILNQMINLVNSISENFGKMDEIRIELARELKQSKEERNEAYYKNVRREKENQVIAQRLDEEFGLRSTRKNVQKWRLFYEVTGEGSKVNAFCIYCGKAFSITQALKGIEVDIEHIIPQSRLFDDSLNNKTLSHRKCNEEKGNMTAYDYMMSKSQADFETYIERIEKLYKDKVISKSKRDKLLMPGNKIPQDFIDRQIRETQYISRKSREILLQVCRNIRTTSGPVTAILRRIWGWDEILMNLQLKKYKEEDLYDIIEIKEIQDEYGNIVQKKFIRGWSKRDDHRHHAIDALIVACTSQGFIQRINTLNRDQTREEMYEDVKKQYDDKKSLLENYLYSHKPFSTNDVEKAVSQILISFKPGKKVTTSGVRKIRKNRKKLVIQTGIEIPRGPLSEESVYGKIKTMQKDVPLKMLFKNPDLIVKEHIQKKIYERINECGGDWETAYVSCRNSPIYLDIDRKIELNYGTIFKDEYVIKYPLLSFKAKDIESVVDEGLKAVLIRRLEAFDMNEKEAFKDLDANPVWLNEKHKIPINTIRCFTGLTIVETVKRDSQGNEVGFVKPGNNHHIALYFDESGKLQEHVVTFWHAVERKKYAIPIIIKNPSSVWDSLTESKVILPEAFLEKLPPPDWQYKTSMQQNEMFVIGMQNEEFYDTIRNHKRNVVSDYLYRVQKVSAGFYVFRHHLETRVDDIYNGVKNDVISIRTKKLIRIRSMTSWLKNNPIKVTINRLGELFNADENTST